MEWTKNQACTVSDSQACSKLASRYSTRVPWLTLAHGLCSDVVSISPLLDSGSILSQMHRVGGFIHIREGLKVSSMGTSLPAGGVTICPRKKKAAFSICNTGMRSSLCKDSSARQSQTHDFSRRVLGKCAAEGWVHSWR